MSDDKTKVGEGDRDYEVEYWTKQLNVTADQLRRAVNDVGPMVADVRALLGK